MIEISKEYAIALFELAKETGLETEFHKALQDIKEAFSMQPEYYSLLSSPNIPMKERRELMETTFASFPEYVVSWLELLCEKGHIQKLPDCIKRYEDLYEASLNVSEALITSAVELTEEEKAALIRNLERQSSHTVIARYTIDESLLGGLLIRMDDRVIDGSLRHKLNEVKEVMDK